MCVLHAYTPQRQNKWDMCITTSICEGSTKLSINSILFLRFWLKSTARLWPFPWRNSLPRLIRSYYQTSHLFSWLTSIHKSTTGRASLTFYWTICAAVIRLQPLQCHPRGHPSRTSAADALAASALEPMSACVGSLPSSHLHDISCCPPVRSKFVRPIRF